MHDEIHEEPEIIERIFAFGPDDGPTPDVAGIRYHEDDQDPALLTEAGRLAVTQGRALERAYVGEAMARECHYALWLASDDDARDSHLRHAGAADVLALLPVHVLVPFRGAVRLDRIARRILAARAGNELRDRRDSRGPWLSARLEEIRSYARDAGGEPPPGIEPRPE